MIENRRFYRLPSHARFVLGSTSKVYSGKSVNISFGGAFVHLLNVHGLNTGDRLKCTFMLNDNSPVLTAAVQVKRVAWGSTSPESVSGVGVEFLELSTDVKRTLDEFILGQKRVYELLGTLLANTEPDLRSIRPLLSKIPLQRGSDPRDLRVFVESALQSIQLVEQRNAERFSQDQA